MSNRNETGLKMEPCKQGLLLLKGRKDNEKEDLPIEESEDGKKEEEGVRADSWKWSVCRRWLIIMMMMQNYPTQ